MRLLQLEVTNFLGRFCLKVMQKEKSEAVECRNQKKQHKQGEKRKKSGARAAEK